MVKYEYCTLKFMKGARCVNVQETVAKVLVLVLVLNAASYSLAQIFGLMNKGVDIVTVREHSGEKAIYLIGGCQCRTIRPFDFLLDVLPEDAAVYLVEYRNVGLDLDRAADCILQHIWAQDHTEVTFVAISMGYQLVAACQSDESKIIALNPCIGRESLLPKLQGATHVLPLCRLGLFVLGWASLLPVVKINGEPYYSLQLLMDQFKVAATDYDENVEPFRPEVMALSRNDNVIDNDALLDAVTNEPKVYWIDTIHFGFVDNGPLYRDAVAENLS